MFNQDEILEKQGYVVRIIFRNEENGYTVFVLETKQDGEEVCTGKFNYIEEGMYLWVKGKMEERRYREPQLGVFEYDIREPEDAVEMERYLASGVIKGIGPALAKKIVTKFGDETFRVMEEEPISLALIKGISEKMAQKIAEQFAEKSNARHAMMLMQKYGIANKTAAKLYKQFGDRIHTILEENPYRLADEVSGIGFRKADEIAMRSGISVDSDYRIQSAIVYVLHQQVANGHVYYPVDLLKEELESLLHFDVSEIGEHLSQLHMERKVYFSESRVYLTNYYYMELNCARMLHDLNLKTAVDEKKLIRRIENILEREDLELESRQIDAVVQSVKNGVMILTGGPGTGKTTTINAMIRFFDEEGMEVLLAAPTGRAARRMKEATKCEAQTIHRLLGVTVAEENDRSFTRFERNAECPLEADVVIIDETSMVDLPLLHALLSAVVPGTRIIFVGDVNQLPSVGAGNCLRDMIESECFCVVKLNQIFRQAASSDIVQNAHRVNRGEYPVIDNKRSKDFFFLEREDPKDIMGHLYYLINNGLTEFVESEKDELQILTPVRKGPLGVERINMVMQKYLNPESERKNEIEWNDRTFRVGDKVMQIKNNYKLEWEIYDDYGGIYLTGSGVYNGDIGVIRDINKEYSALKVEFEEGKIVEYDFQDLQELEHAYAITIHKSQGSEYPAVLIPLIPGTKLLYNRNLLYTAITRAKKCVVVIGDRKVMEDMVDNNQEKERYTSLSKRIQMIREMEEGQS